MTIKSVEKLENAHVRIVAQVDSETFNKYVDEVYRKTRGSIMIPGFRKGKAPRKIIEQFYGSDIFVSDAIDECASKVFNEVLAEADVIPEAPASLENANPNAEGLELAYIVTVMPEEDIEGYLDLDVTKPEVNVTEEQVDKEMENYQIRASRMIESDEPVKDQDTVEMDYVGYIDGVPFEGGSANNYSLTVGSHRFIPGFEEQLIGHSAGEEFDITVTFPEDYQSAEVAGKEAVFHIVLHAVKVMDKPALDDELAKDVSEFDTLAELRADTEVQLKKQAEANANNQYANAVMAALVAKVTVEIPKEILDYYVSQEKSDLEQRLKNYGMTFETYCEMQGASPAFMEQFWRENCKNEYLQCVVLDAIARAEDLTVEEDEQDGGPTRNQLRRKALKVLEQHYGFNASGEADNQDEADDLDEADDQDEADNQDEADSEEATEEKE